ncbi:hypothetical protein VNI00_004517 [Paramarasmius palmivorus]|uniref:Uncharacterized protein n=1 Tax=Paramarasmius palmivorus TaxID=297713 RepID=A0AAW0DJK0_9AGAR
MDRTNPESPSNLPPELCDAIIDCLDGDFATLKSTFEVDPNNIRELRSLLECSCGFLLASVHSIHLTGRIREQVDGCLEELDGIAKLLHAQLKEITFSYPGPKNLLKQPRLLNNLSQSITTLSLYHDAYRLDGREILFFLSYFKKTLECLNMYLDTPRRALCSPDQPSPPYPESMRMLRLRRLKINVPWHDILPWFLIPGLVEFPALEELDIWMAQSPLRGEGLLHQFLSSLCAKTLQHLVVSFMYETLPDINLSKFGALRSIKFDGWGAENATDSEVEKLVTIVSRAPASGKSFLDVFVTDSEYKPPPSAEKLKDRIRWFEDEWEWETRDGVIHE